MTSRPAIDPAISILPVKNQLIAKVSSVPMVRQLIALRTDLVCVSAPRNKTTRYASHGSTMAELTMRQCPARRRMVRAGCQNRKNRPWISVYFARRNQENSLIKLDNRDRRGSPADPGQFRWSPSSAYRVLPLSGRNHGVSLRYWFDFKRYRGSSRPASDRQYHFRPRIPAGIRSRQPNLKTGSIKKGTDVHPMRNSPGWVRFRSARSFP